GRPPPAPGARRAARRPRSPAALRHTSVWHPLRAAKGGKSRPGATAGSAGEPGHRSDDRRRRPERATRLDRAGRAPGRGPATRRPAGTAELSLGSAPGAHRLPAGERPLVRRRLAGHRHAGLRSSTPRGGSGTGVAAMVRVGIAGIGFMGVTHYKAYASVAGAEVAAVLTRDAVR